MRMIRLDRYSKQMLLAICDLPIHIRSRYTLSIHIWTAHLDGSQDRPPIRSQTRNNKPIEVAGEVLLVLHRVVVRGVVREALVHHSNNKYNPVEA